MFKKVLKNQKGLTLIELLAVVVILGIIAAIAVPAIGNVISNSQRDSAVAEAQQIIDSARLYITTETPTFDTSGATPTLTVTQNNSGTTVSPTQTGVSPFESYLNKADNFTLTVERDTNGILSFEITNHTANGFTFDGVTANDGLTDAEILTILD
ncbi:type II secretion system protein [Fredinandcohnia sp. 179-A 10B2 NHS]|uniref:type II secretion system protein n=1 Tax=Fredinandcohnia sp. 179-A 10B2 NHS TaxID=3235176 RepID=UPI0039A2417B